MEAFHLGAFMVSAGTFGVLLESPKSPLSNLFSNELTRRAAFGLAMALTAIAIIYSPWGRQSGAHMNPAVTATYWLLGKVRAVDAVAYIVAQFIGGIIGVLCVLSIFQGDFANAPVNFVATTPGTRGASLAFVSEAAISFLLMSVVLRVSNTKKLATYTGLFAGSLVFLYITFEAPLSGMSMNPARTFASAFPGHLWTSLWVYFTAPFIGMISAATVFQQCAGAKVYCAKLNHNTTRRCIFNCQHDQLLKT